MKSNSLERIQALDGLRALAILSVVFHHLTSKPNADVIPGFIWSLYNGRTGVRLFFVLSGFLITRLIVTELRETGSFSLPHFWIRRFFRIVPPLILFLVGAAFFHIVGWISIEPLSFVAALSCTSNFFRPPIISVEFLHLWSLAVEEQFYAVWPLATMFGLRRAHQLLILFVVVCVVVRWWVEWTPSLGSYSRYWIRNYTIPAADSIAIGCIFAFTKKSLHRHGAVLMAVAVLWLAPVWFQAHIVKGFAFPLQSVGFGLLIAWLAQRPRHFLATVLSLSPLVWLGGISYELYLWQGLFLRTSGDGIVWMQRWPQNLILAVFTAILAQFLLRERILAIRDRMVART